MINVVVVSGRITKDLNLRKTQSGASVVNFTLASDRMKKKDQEQQADFIAIQAWGKTADILCQYCHKGSLIALEGRIQTRNYDGADGKKVYVTEVVAENVQLMDGARQTSSSREQAGDEPSSKYEATSTEEIDDDSLPF